MPDTGLKHGSLFSGIGGFDLAAEWMGWENVFHCEWNEFGQKVLKYYWPNAVSYDDICKTDFTIWRGKIDILTGGFPCQPYSMAGKRKGTEDSRHLWPEMLRAIRECRPTWIVGENVPGLVNWSGGLVFEQVCADLEGEGYEVQPVVLPACGVNAPHRRDRVWIVAYSNSDGYKLRGFGEDRSEENIGEEIKEERERIWNDGWGIGESRTAADPKRTGRQECHATEITTGQRHSAGIPVTDWTNWPAVAPLCHGNDGLPSELDGITFSKWRNESIKAGGNAVTPPLVFKIFQVIQIMHNETSIQTTQD